MLTRLEMSGHTARSNLEKDDGDVTISYYDASRGSLRFAHNPYVPSVPDLWEFFLPMMVK